MINLNKFSIIFSLTLLTLHLSCVKGNSCISCEGINCLRKSLNQTEVCADSLDVCVTIFKDFTIERKGCLLSTPEELRSKCDDKGNLECDICEGDLCNKYGRKDFTCVECDTAKDKKCDQNPSELEPVRCLAPTSINSYCYIERQNGKVTKRGCSIDTAHQKQCLASKDSSCTLCIPKDTEVCNAPSKKVIKELSCPASSASGLQKISILGIGIAFLTIKNLF